MQTRVYVIEYDFNAGFYTGKEKVEHRVLHYTKEERDSFIKEYQRLKENEYIYNNNINTYYGELKKINMEDIINAI
jgi:hypothetical protein